MHVEAARVPTHGLAPFLRVSSKVSFVWALLPSLPSATGRLLAVFRLPQHAGVDDPYRGSLADSQGQAVGRACVTPSTTGISWVPRPTIVTRGIRASGLLKLVKELPCESPTCPGSRRPWKRVR